MALRAIFMSAVVLACCAPRSLAQGGPPQMVGFELRAWEARNFGVGRARRAGLVGSRLDFKHDLDLRDDSRLMELTLGFRAGDASSFTGTYLNTTLGGAGPLRRAVSYDGVVFPAGEVVDSNLGLTLAKVIYRRDLRYNRAGPSLLLGASFAAASLRVTGASGEGEARVGWRAPLVGAGFFLPLGETTGLLKNMRLRVEGLAHLPLLVLQDGIGLEVNTGVEWMFWPAVTFELGYKFMDLNLKSSGSSSRKDFRMTFKGPSLSVHIRF